MPLLIVSVFFFDRREIALIVFLINLAKRAAENVPTESEVNLLTEKRRMITVECTKNIHVNIFSKKETIRKH